MKERISSLWELILSFKCSPFLEEIHILGKQVLFCWIGLLLKWKAILNVNLHTGDYLPEIILSLVLGGPVFLPVSTISWSQ